MADKNSPMNQSGVLINAIYMMSLSLDLMLRNAEWRMNLQREAFKKEKKQLFSRYTTTVRTACFLQDQLTQDIYDMDAKYNYRNVDVWLDEANELARLILLFADRSSNTDVVDDIFRHIRSLPGEGIVDEKMLESFYLK